jgi:cell division transport system permease protein
MIKYITKILKSGWSYLWRQGFLSFATSLVIFIAVVLGTVLIIFHGGSDFMTRVIEDKIDISVYFNDQVSVDKILEIRDQLLKDKKDVISKVEFVSAEDAYAGFTKEHTDDTYTQSLDAIGSNPFLPALVVQTKDPSQYKAISQYFKQDQFKELIYDMNDYRREFAIQRLSNLSVGINRMGLAVTIFLSLIALIITFNTLRLSIYSQKEEIEIMRLVGAKNSFVRWPFLIQGALCGFIASILAFIVFLIALFAFRGSFEQLFMGFNPFNYFVSNILLILIAQLAIGVGLGFLSSFFAVRRYLKD